MQDPQPDQASQYDTRPVELGQRQADEPLLTWVVVESPDRPVLLAEDDHVLDSHYNPEFDNWEVLLRLAPSDETQE